MTATTPVAATQVGASTSVVATMPQVEGLKGNVQVDNGALWLRWSAYTTGAEKLLLYRSDRDDETLQATRELVAELPADTTAYQENAPLCDQNYFVVALVGGKESLPSQGSYYTAACQND